MSRSFSIYKATVMFFCLLYLYGLIYGKFLLSVSMISLAALALFNSPIIKARLSFLNNVPDNSRSAWIPSLSIILVFVLILLSGVHSDNLSYWAKYGQLKLPYLVMPLAFLFLPQWERKDYFNIHYFFIALCFISIFPLLQQYYQNFELINDNIKRGGHFETPTHHIRYSLMLAYATISSIILIYNNHKLKFNWEKYLLLIMGISLFIFVHVLAVRSGIVAMYLTIGIVLVSQWIRSKKIIQSAILVYALLAIPIISYSFLPSLQEKVNYTFYQLSLPDQEVSYLYSDIARMNSIEAGLHVWKKNKIFGVGGGDFGDEIKNYYQETYPNERIKKPHSQFVFALSRNGLLGLLALLISISVPWFYKKAIKNPLHLAFGVIIWSSLLSEATMETAVGIGFFLFFVCLAINRKSAIAKT